jgi:hypothetical protein
MKNYKLIPFQQSDLLKNEHDADLKHGICVALSDHWLKLIRESNTQTPENRLIELTRFLPAARHYQLDYSKDRAKIGRIDARRKVGETLGLNYSEQTTILKSFIGIVGIKARMKADISSPGKAATWTLRFDDGSGHAIAGFCGIESIPVGFRYRIHIFDPNIGEYTGALEEVDTMLHDLLHKFPIYKTLVHVHRLEDKDH